ncbi:MAG TPA: transglycosylase SLT domain-containing protein [Geothrix sp.]|nr:transglycosylase SLT domain-containing protein [Geothrix sp.]
MNPFVNVLGWALIHALWQGCLLVLVAALSGLLLQTRSRHRMNGLILCLCLVLPTATAWRFHRAAPAAFGMAEEVASVEGPEQDIAPLGRPSRTWLARVEAALHPHLPRLVALWALGAGLMAVRLGGGVALSLRWKRQGIPAPRPWQDKVDALARRMGILRKVRLLLLNHGDTPMALGLWKPVVLVPASLLSGVPPDCLEALLAHELAHVGRLDYLGNLLQGIVETLLFFHPAVWWLSARIRDEREELADHLAVRHLGDARRLALALDALDDFQAAIPRPLFPALAARGGRLITRIERLLSPRPMAGSHWGLFSLLLLPGAVLALRAAVPQQPSIPAPSALVAQVDALAAKEGLDPQLLRSMAWVESNFNATATSPAGAMGLLQVLPATARAYGAKDLGDPAQVMAAGAKYLRFLLDRYQGDVQKAVAAYNCGHEALDGGRITPEATRYRALVLDVFQARAVQPEPPLAEGEVQGVIRQAGRDRMTVRLRISARRSLKVDLLRAEDSLEIGSVRMGAEGGAEADAAGLWKEYNPTIIVKPIGVGATLLVRCEDPRTGLRAETRVLLDGPWKTFRMQMEKPRS